MSPPRILAIETSTGAGGAALWEDGAVAAARENDSSTTHSERLLAAIDSLLREAGRALTDLDAIAVSIGPGSFMGLRIGLAVAKALAFSTGTLIVPVSTLEALAWRFAQPGQLAAALLDARRREVFGALFEGSARDGAPLRLTPDVAERPEMFARRIDRPCVFGGSGAERYADSFREWLGARFALAPAELSRTSASAVAALGAKLFGQGKAANPLTIEPRYVRKSDAEVARERKSTM